MRSAIYLPPAGDIPPELIQILEEPPLGTVLKLLSNADTTPTAQQLRAMHGQLLEPFTDEDITTALHIIQDPLRNRTKNESKQTIHAPYFAAPNTLSCKDHIPGRSYESPLQTCPITGPAPPRTSNRSRLSSDSGKQELLLDSRASFPTTNKTSTNERQASGARSQLVQSGFPRMSSTVRGSSSDSITNCSHTGNGKRVPSHEPRG